jgi:hypothetical protein
LDAPREGVVVRPRPALRTCRRERYVFAQSLSVCRRNAETIAEIGSAEVMVGSEWKMYFAQAVATRDYSPGAAAATIQLASASQTIDLGPVFILDFGPDYDRSSLPTN